LPSANVNFNVIKEATFPNKFSSKECNKFENFRAKKAAHEIVVRLTPVVNFTNIL
jgi:hypothetical protein